MHALTQSAFLKALGWTLLDSFWQFALLFLFMYCVTVLKKNLSPAVRHGLALGLLLTGAAWFVFDLVKNYFRLDAGGFETATLDGFAESSAVSRVIISVREFMEANVNYLSFLYLLFVSALSCKFLRYFFHFHKIRTTGITKLRAGLRLQVQQLAAQLGITRKVQVWVSSLIDTPMIIGFLRPVILVPVASLNYLSVTQLEAILLHELAHIKRNDYLINLFVISFEIAFFFNPFARLLVRAIKQERENSCDDWVLQFRFDRHQYASALLALEQGRSSFLSAAIAATGKNKKRLLHRVQRIMQVKTHNDYRFPFFSYFLLGVIILLAALLNGAPVLLKEADGRGYTHFAALDHLPGPRVQTHAAVKINPDASAKRPERQLPTEIRVKKPHVITSESDEALAMYIQSVIDKSEEPSVHLVSMEEPEQEFAIAEADPVLPPAGSDLHNFPFVPNSSFSVVIAGDTAKPKIKKESYHERIARESLVKAKMAIDRIDWNKIEKELRSKVNVEKLRKEIEQSLEVLNWKEINEEAKASINKEAEEDMQESLRNEFEEMKRLKQQEQQYRLIQKDLEEKQEKYRRETEKQVNLLQLRLAEVKTIVHI